LISVDYADLSFQYAGFQDRCHQPLGHLSELVRSYESQLSVIREIRLYSSFTYGNERLCYCAALFQYCRSTSHAPRACPHSLHRRTRKWFRVRIILRLSA